MELSKLLERRQEIDVQVEELFDTHRAKCGHHLRWTDRIPVDRCSNPNGQSLSDTPYGYVCLCKLERCPTVDK